MMEQVPLLSMERIDKNDPLLDNSATANNDFSMEDSPSYEILNSHNLLTKKYRVASEDELKLEQQNSTRLRNTILSLLTCPCFMFSLSKGFEVPSGSLKAGYDGRGNYTFFGPGVHQILDPYYKVNSNNLLISSQVIQNGDRFIVTVDQGFIGYCMERGQPILLPPGLHQWQSSTLKFVKMIDLNQPVIQLGPWTLLTIDQGYMAVTQDNGKQRILEGGSVYLLPHRNHKFEKFISTKVQTNDLERIEAASADNVIILVDATVLWRVSDVDTAVKMSVKTMNSDGSKAKALTTTTKLQNDILKQAEASLAYFIGTINFSDSMAAAAMTQRNRDQDLSDLPIAVAQPSDDQSPQDQVEFNLYNNGKLEDAVSHANEITKTYGVVIIGINIISAIPADENLRKSLAAGAVAAAEAQMMETTAKGKSRAIKIEAKATAEQTMILAKADADAEILRAEGAKQAADLLACNPVSVDLAKIERTGKALAGDGNHASFFFGAEPHDLKNLLANGSVIKGGDQALT
mmetsp:Transcript_15118/g.22274  ORF Transcript_15118/g.22274 Transcript_15118/m.22274 type:complete len:518 (+) Transcript_15118:59-1612(+)|eukprot:CAMPEP_0194211792 /NCGR_PEP_ID=MMETSP0156-20130528/11179_1 /TAXON_ID=33649 /ORGANISM="Thalassionema nitzschioides, Strain L26-B" /LENGTH=517 /DNA_ID=CAMNT_0038939455 /DNA_START=44 /DNA_END=1597 /DNA_ORIENTATION=-